MSEGSSCDFCGSSMAVVGGLYAAPRASICLTCAQTAVEALQNRAELSLTGVTSLQLPPGSVITTPEARPAAAPTVTAAPASRRAGLTLQFDTRLVARLMLVGLAALLISRRRGRR